MRRREPRRPLAPGGFLAHSNLDKANLSGGSFYLSSTAFWAGEKRGVRPHKFGATSAVNATMNGTTLNGAELNLTNFVGA